MREGKIKEWEVMITYYWGLNVLSQNGIMRSPKAQFAIIY